MTSKSERAVMQEIFFGMPECYSIDHASQKRINAHQQGHGCWGISVYNRIRTLLRLIVKRLEAVPKQSTSKQEDPGCFIKNAIRIDTIRSIHSQPEL